MKVYNLDDDPVDLDDYRLWHGQRPLSVAAKRGASYKKLLVRGSGCWVEDVAGRRYLDARAGIANVCLGYGRDDVVEAMHRQARDLPMACIIRHERPAKTTIEYAAALAAAAPAGLDRVRLTHMGSASVENALLLTRQYFRNAGRAEKKWIVSLEGSFHGTTLMSIAASGDPGLHNLFGSMPDGFAQTPKPHMPEDSDGIDFSDDLESPSEQALSDLEKLIDSLGSDKIAAVLVEPVMGTRVEPLPAAFVRGLRRLCDDIGAFLIFDEIVTGFGRIGSMWAAEAFDVIPDIMCLAKGITGGYATMGAVLTSEEVFLGFEPPNRPHFANGSSTDGHPIACAAGLEILQIFKRESVVSHASEMGAELAALLRQELAQLPCVGGIRSVGMFIGIEIEDPNGAPVDLGAMRHLRESSEARGLLVQHSDNVLIIQPPLTISRDECEFITATLGPILKEFARSLSREIATA